MFMNTKKHWSALWPLYSLWSYFMFSWNDQIYNMLMSIYPPVFTLNSCSVTTHLHGILWALALILNRNLAMKICLVL